MNFNFDLVVTSFPLLLLGAGVTIKITVMSVALGVLIGLFVGIARICRVKPLRFLAAVYVDFFRGTPLLVQIFLFYFAVPVITGQRIDPYVAAVGSCGINSGAYVAEIVRAGIQSIDEGQMEAGRSLGMTWAQTMRYIIVPSSASSRRLATSSSRSSRTPRSSRSSASRSSRAAASSSSPRRTARSRSGSASPSSTWS